MLTKFAVRNFRGFKDRIELDLTRHSNYTFNQYAIKGGIIKNGIIFGPNGSGKSNFSLAIFDIVNHLTQKWKKADYYKNFTYADMQTEFVDFEYSFDFGGHLLEYFYSKDFNGVLKKERLIVDGVAVFNRADGSFNVDLKAFPMDMSIQRSLAENANNVSIVNFLLTSYPLPSGHYLLLLQQFVNGMLWFRNLDVRDFIGLDTSPYYLDEFIIKNGLAADFSTFLNEVSDQKFVFSEPKEGDRTLSCLIDGNLIPFQEIASTGTKSLQLLYFWMKKMNDASFVFIDEFDAFYHFRLSFEVCKRLFNLQCQVFTSSHNTYLMTNDLLRPDCNFILDKGKIKPLVDCTEKELRFGHNIEKLFRGNVFRV